MGTKKRYSGYRSFDYLQATRDFREFELIEGQSPFEPYLLPVTEQQQARVDELAERLLMISLHEHPHLFPADLADMATYDKQARIATAYEALAGSCWDCVFDNFQNGTNFITSKGGWKWSDVIYDMGMRLCDLAHQDFLIKCETVDDMHRAHREGRIALVAAQEGAMMIENELDRIEILYGIGLRVLGITYSESNALGTGLKEDGDGGLTAFGRKAVARMNEVGMAIDCAHCSDQTIIDTAAVSAEPIFLTHTGARALWDIRRLAPDEAIRAVADKGGVIGIEAAPHTTVTERHRRHNLESFMEHFEYVRDLVGIDHVAFGPDTLYGDHVGLHHVYAAALSIDASHEGGGSAKAGPVHEPVEYVQGVENPTESSWNILRWLVSHDVSDADIEKVVGGNIVRVLGEAWQ